MFPKNNAVGVALNPGVPVVAVVDPLPDIDRVMVGSEALLVKDTVPAALPLAVGVNVIESA